MYLLHLGSACARVSGAFCRSCLFSQTQAWSLNIPLAERMCVCVKRDIWPPLRPLEAVIQTGRTQIPYKPCSHPSPPLAAEFKGCHGYRHPSGNAACSALEPSEQACLLGGEDA